MDGQLLNVDLQRGEALVKASNGQRYVFNLLQWRGQVQPLVSMTVDFDVSAANEVSNVYPMQGSAVVVQQGLKKKSTATLMSLGLGSIGAHKFYMGAWGWGLLYLVFCWTMIPMFINVIECIHYISLTDDEFNQRAAKPRGAFTFFW